MWEDPARLYHRCLSLRVALQSVLVQMARISLAGNAEYFPLATPYIQVGDIDLDIAFESGINGFEEQHSCEGK